MQSSAIMMRTMIVFRGDQGRGLLPRSNPGRSVAVRHGVHVRAQKCPERVVSSEGRDGDRVRSRRDFVLNSVNVAVLGALLQWGAAPPPSTLGVQDYGGGLKTLSLCPPSPNCISTAEEANDMDHYVPGWTYNPPDGSRGKNPVSQQQAMEELAEVVRNCRADNFTPKIVEKTDDYLHAEFESPTFGFIDDFEAYFPKDRPNQVEYRSASRIGESDGNINRKRIKALRLELQKKGWASLGF